MGAVTATKCVGEGQLWLKKRTAEGLRNAATSPTALLSGQTKRSLVRGSMIPSNTMVAATFCNYTLCRPFLLGFSNKYLYFSHLALPYMRHYLYAIRPSFI